MSAVALSPAPGRYSLSSLSTPVLVRELDALAAQELVTDADVLAHLAELDVRQEYLALGFASMHDYCVRRLRMSEDRANKRIRACRTALEYPIIFNMIADGRLSLTSVLMLKARLTPGNAPALLAEAASLSNDALELLLARRFPRAESPVGAAAPALDLNAQNAGEFEVEVAARPVPVLSSVIVSANSTGPLAVVEPAARTVPTKPSHFAKFTPLSGESVALHGQLSMAAYQQFLRVRALASHVVPSGNAAQVIEYALKLAAELLERKKFGAGARTQLAASSSNPRYVPAAVRQAVCQRDGGRCTFVGPDGTRCNSEWHLQFDHEVPVAMGGGSTVNNLRMLCAKHNRLEAKRKLGADRVVARIEQAKAEAARRRMRKCKRAQPAVLQPEASSNGSNTAAANVGTPSVGVAMGQIPSVVSRQARG